MSTTSDTWIAGKGSAARTRLLPFALLVLSPPSVIALWVAVAHFDADLSAIWSAGIVGFCRHCPAPSLWAAAVLAGFMAFEAVLLRLLPGPEHLGPVTPSGARPAYRGNGVAAFVVTLGTFVLLSGPVGLFDAAVVYDRFGELLVTASLAALLGCVALYFKGVYRPCSRDAGASGRPVFDFFWGTELHPTLGRMQLKQLINCRFSMMGWAVIVVAFAMKQYAATGALSVAMAVNVGLQLVYIFKFFWWERGYFDSLDIMHDRFGFYICWGVCAFLPSLYPVASLFLTEHAPAMPVLTGTALFVAGCAAIWINYQADRQRQLCRATDGDCTIWGRKPTVIRARYTPADGQPRESLLLVSGYWGIARHFHYVPEILLAAAWTAPVGFGHVLPWSYVLFLTALLVDRAARDDRRCATKYGSYWDTYRARVPWRIVPGLY